MRSVVAAMTVAIILPMMYTYGIAVTYTLCAMLIWVSYRYVKPFPPIRNKFVCLMNIFDYTTSGLYYLIKNGDQMRAWVDIGFSKIEDNSKPLPCTCST